MMGEVCMGGGGGWVSYNYATREAIFMYFHDRCAVCVCVNSLWLCLQWLALSV